MSTGFLDKVYELDGPTQTEALYDAWAASYETEIAENGYVTPRRCAEALATFHQDKQAPIFDFGCGTGLSGMALATQGFTCIDGVDLSADMLKRAQHKGVYRHLRHIELGASPIRSLGAYDAIAAIGVIGSGAAPVEMFDTLMNALGPRGKLVLSFNDHTLEDPVYEGRINEWTDCGSANLLFREYGDHLPGINIKSFVYVIEKN